MTESSHFSFLSDTFSPAYPPSPPSLPRFCMHKRTIKRAPFHKTSQSNTWRAYVLHVKMQMCHKAIRRLWNVYACFYTSTLRNINVGSHTRAISSLITRQIHVRFDASHVNMQLPKTSHQIRFTVVQHFSGLASDASVPDLLDANFSSRLNMPLKFAKPKRHHMHPRFPRGEPAERLQNGNKI